MGETEATFLHLQLVEVVVDLDGIAVDVLHDLVNVRHAHHFVALHNEDVHSHVLLAGHRVILNLFVLKEVQFVISFHTINIILCTFFYKIS